MKTICIIPARGGSKGLKKKNVRLLAGRPLIQWPVIAAKKNKLIDAVFVSTDDPEIADEAIRAGADVPFLRGSEFAEDLTTTESTLQNALVAYEEYRDIKYDIGVFLTATDIFRDPEWISIAISKMQEDQNLESVFAAYKTTKNFWSNESGSWQRVKPWMSEYSSRQIRDAIYREDTGLTCASRCALWRAGRRIGDRVEIIVNKSEESFIDIHSEFDLYLAEASISYLKKIHPERVKLFIEADK